MPSSKSEQSSFATQGKVCDSDVVEFASDYLLIFSYWWDIFFFENNTGIVFIASTFFEVKPFKDAFGEDEFENLLSSFHTIKIVNKLTTLIVSHLF